MSAFQPSGYDGTPAPRLVGLLEKSMNWYAKTEHEARKIAERQGFEGVRWQKMTDPDGRLWR